MVPYLLVTGMMLETHLVRLMKCDYGIVGIFGSQSLLIPFQEYWHVDIFISLSCSKYNTDLEFILLKNYSNFEFIY